MGCYVLLLVVWLPLFPFMVVVLLLGGSLLLFDCELGSGYCYVVSCMLLCHGWSFCSGCRILFLCILLSCALILHIWSMSDHFLDLRGLVDCHFAVHCDQLVCFDSMIFLDCFKLMHCKLFHFVLFFGPNFTECQVDDVGFFFWWYKGGQ